MAISLKELSERIAASIPVGTIVAYHGTSAPSGWLICDGRSCAGTALASLLGKNNVPDLRGRFIRMIGGNAAGMGVAQGDELKSHTHTFVIRMDADEGGGGPWYGTPGNGHYGATRTSNPTSSAGGAETRPINMAFNYIIRAIA